MAHLGHINGPCDHLAIFAPITKILAPGLKLIIPVTLFHKKKKSFWPTVRAFTATLFQQPVFKNSHHRGITMVLKYYMKVY